MTNGVLVQIHLTVSPVGPQIDPVLISSVLKFIARIGTLSSWQKLHIASLTREGFMLKEPEWKMLELPLSKKYKPKAVPHFQRDCRN